MYRHVWLGLLVVLGASTASAQDPSRAEIGLYVVDIPLLDERSSTFEIELDVISSWVDPRRATGKEQRYRNDEASKFLDAGWSANAFLTNAKSGVGLSNLYTAVQPDGRVVNRARVNATLRAPLDFRRFPFDRQSLTIHVESFSHDVDRLELLVDESFSGFAQDFDMPEWQVLGTESRTTQRLRVQEGREYSRIEFTVNVKRKVGYYVWKVILPVLLITAISWVVFWMSTDALGRRAGISATGMLTVIAYQFIIAGSLPRFPYLTVLDKIALLALVLIALTMVENLVTSRMDEADRHEFDRRCRIAFPLALS
jgi:hypothetical protein